jgi:hypothetical protein
MESNVALTRTEIETLIFILEIQENEECFDTIEEAVAVTNKFKLALKNEDLK